MINPPPEELISLTIDRFWETIPPLWNGVKMRLRAAAAEQFGITVEQFHILRHVRKGMSSVSELAEVKQISRSAISQALDALVDKGLITRCQESGDRRYVRLELTAHGRDLLDAIFNQNRAWMAGKLQRLSPAELQQLVQAMDLLKTAFARND
jgi:MarR family transcriptional regulator, 2-MHQ and catechol-resistance regulon repressor